MNWDKLMDVIDYEAVVADFNTKLVTQLRSHGAEFEYLEMWVPDPDPARSILNMVEAAQAYGQREIQVRVAETTLSRAGVDMLRAEIGRLGKISLTTSGDTHWLVSVTGL